MPDHTRILQEMCSLPTAPFVEGSVVDYVARFAKRRRKLRLSQDPHGNLLLELPGRKRGQPRWVFGAHIDHPGLIARRMVDARTVEADFRGYVLAEYMKNMRVVFFPAGGGQIRGRIVEVEPDPDGPRARVVRVRVGEEVPTATAGMFDLGEGRFGGGKFYARGCDDVAGAAGALAMLDELHARPPAASVAVLLTRAEEDGFIGAMAAVHQPKLLQRSDRIISIECSAMQPYAPQGKGPIIRVGDKTSIFNSALTYYLTQQAEGLKKADRAFQYLRALMPGGTCEATVYDVYGFQAAAICVALGNYHNMDHAKKRIAPEYIDVEDWNGMVRLFVAIARHAHEAGDGFAALRDRIEKRFAERKHLLKSPGVHVAGKGVRWWDVL